MEKETKNTVLIIDKAADERFEFVLSDDIKVLKDYLAEPDKYNAVFRETTLIHGATYREAYDLAKSHQKDDYYYKPEGMYPDETVSESAEYLIEQLTEGVYEIEEDYEDKNKAWDEYAQDFFWARRLNAAEEKAVREKYGI